MEMFETKSSFFGGEMEKLPIDPVNIGVSISFPQKISKNLVNAIEDMDRKFIDRHWVDKNGLKNRFNKSGSSCKIEEF